MTNFDKVIPPGSEGKVHAKVDISHASGSLAKSITVESNDPDTPTVNLTIKATVKQYVTTSVDMVRFQVDKGQSIAQEVTLNTAYEKPITLSNPKVDSEDFKVEMTPVDKGPQSEQKAYQLKVTISPQATAGEHRATVKIDAAGSPQETVEIPVYAKVSGPITAQPPVVTFQVRTFPETVKTTQKVNIRELPNTASPIVMKAEKGQVFSVMMQNPEWYQVIATENQMTKGVTKNTGWMSKKYVQPEKEQSPTKIQTVNLIDKAGPFKVLDYTVNIPELKLELNPTGTDGKQYQLTVTVQPGKELQRNTPPGKIIIKTDDKDVPELTIPVYVMVS